MENASKALIIAGSILLSILIIALGMFIFSSSSSTSDTMGSTLSENEKQTFNIKFEKYLGKQSGSSVASLVSTIRSTAVSNKTSADMIVSVDFYDKEEKNNVQLAGQHELTDDSEDENISTSGYVEGLSNITNSLVKSHDYEVSVEYNQSGLVSKVIIEYTKGQKGT